jgi:hypothetical protein
MTEKGFMKIVEAVELSDKKLIRKVLESLVVELLNRNNYASIDYILKQLTSVLTSLVDRQIIKVFNFNEQSVILPAQPAAAGKAGLDNFVSCDEEDVV